MMCRLSQRPVRLPTLPTSDNGNVDNADKYLRLSAKYRPERLWNGQTRAFAETVAEEAEALNAQQRAEEAAEAAAKRAAYEERVWPLAKPCRVRGATLLALRANRVLAKPPTGKLPPIGTEPVAIFAFLPAAVAACRRLRPCGRLGCKFSPSACRLCQQPDCPCGAKALQGARLVLGHIAGWVHLQGLLPFRASRQAHGGTEARRPGLYEATACPARTRVRGGRRGALRRLCNATGHCPRPRKGAVPWGAL